MRRSLGLVAMLVCGSAAGQSLADRGPPPQRLFHRSVIGARVNPVGLVYDGRLSYRLRLYENESLALRDNFVGGGVAAQISPASLRVGPFIEVAPATFLTMRRAGSR